MNLQREIDRLEAKVQKRLSRKLQLCGSDRERLRIVEAARVEVFEKRTQLVRQFENYESGGNR